MKPLSRFWLVALSLGPLALAPPPAGAASVFVVPDAWAADLGEQIRLSVYVSVASTESDDAIFGAIQLTGPTGLPSGITSIAANNQQFALPGWATSAPALTCTTAFCQVFSQTNTSMSNHPAADVTGFLIARLVFDVSPGMGIGSLGPLTFHWRTAPTSQDLDFFDVQGGLSTGATVFVGAPEPTTAALLGLGLIGISLRARRRS